MRTQFNTMHNSENLLKLLYKQEIIKQSYYRTKLKVQNAYLPTYCIASVWGEAGDNMLQKFRDCHSKFLKIEDTNFFNDMSLAKCQLQHKWPDKVVESAAKYSEIDPWFNLPNLISTARLISGPPIAYLICQNHWTLASIALTVSGLSDWYDGYIARRYNMQSIVGTYLDPLADKVLVGSAILALANTGFVPHTLALLIIMRDIMLIAGSFYQRFMACKFQWPGAAEFFKTRNKKIRHVQSVELCFISGGKLTSDLRRRVSEALNELESLPKICPNKSSKWNTFAQLSLAGSCVIQSMLGIHIPLLNFGLGSIVLCLTLQSGWEYYKFRHLKSYSKPDLGLHVTICETYCLEINKLISSGINQDKFSELLPIYDLRQKNSNEIMNYYLLKFLKDDVDGQLYRSTYSHWLSRNL